MSRKYKHGDRRRKPEAEQKEAQAVDESSVIIKQFLGYQQELDAIHDKHERLVKLSRDVTIESKRTIFLLQRISGDKEKDNIISEAHKRLEDIQKQKWRSIAEELKGEDPFKYLKAYSPGLQEYIEALSFCNFLEFQTLIPLDQVQATLCFPEQEPDTSENDNPKPTQDDQASPTDQSMDTPAQPIEPDSKGLVADNSNNPPPSTITVHIPPMEYMLGVADLTGEVMRMAIHSVSSNDTHLPFDFCAFLRTVYDAFVQFGSLGRELSRKLYTLKQSLRKVESVCYTLQVRGSEFPKHMLQEMMKNVATDTHEGTEIADCM